VWNGTRLPAFFSVKVTGGKQIEKALKELEPKLAKKVVRKACRDGAKVLKEEIEKTAPQDTGALAASVKIKTKFRKGIASATAEIGEGNFKGETFYAAMVEFGTSKQPPQGYMQQAFDNKKEQVAKQTEDAIRQGIDKIVKDSTK